MSNKVPEGWRRVALGDVAERSTQTFDPTTGDARRYVALENITPGRRTIESFGCSSDTKSTKTIFEASDVLFGKLRPYLRKVVLPEQSGVCSTDIFAIRPTKSVISEFLYAVMADERTIQFAVNHSRGTKMPRTSWKELAKLPILLPPLPEQKKIAAILSSVDEAIEATEAVIEQTRTVKQGLLQELLTRGIGHSEFKKTPIGEIPKSWEVVKIREIATVVGGNGFPVKYQGRIDQQIPFYKVSDMNTQGNEIIMGKSANYISEKTAKELSVRIHPEGTVIFPKVGAALLTDKRRILGQEAVVDNNIMGIVAKSVEPRFLFYAMHRVSFKQLFHPGALPSINQNDVGSIRLGLPCRDEQRAIVTTLYSLDESISASEKKVSQLKQIKKGLLQDLLTGKVRVKTAEGARSEDGEELAEAMAE